VGVQSSGYPSMRESLAAGHPIDLEPQTIADGTTAPVDASNLDLLRIAIDEWVTVREERLRPKIGELAARCKVVAEGAGVLGQPPRDQLAPGPLTAVMISGGTLAPALLAESLAV